MDVKYSIARDEMSLLKTKLKKVLNEAPYEGFENKIAYQKIEELLEQIDSAISEIDQFSKPAVEGILRKNDLGRYELIDSNGSYIGYFTSGSPIECFVDFGGELDWVAGRVEHRRKDGQADYYFYGADNPFLFEGMRARIRKGL